MAKKNDSSIQLFDLSLFGSSNTQLLSLLKNRLKEGKFTLIFTPNPEQVIQSRDSREFRTNLAQADILLPDGIGLVWASRLLSLRNKSAKLTARIAGREVVTDLLELADQQNLKVLVLGGREYPVKENSKLQTPNSKQIPIIKYQNYQSIYWLSGYQDINKPIQSEEQQIRQVIKDLRPEIVFVGFGAPAQEKWLVDHKKLLQQAGVKLGMAVGGTFDYLLGIVSRCPRWLSNLGLEWLFRLVTQPWRLKRQLRLISFMSLVGKELFSFRIDPK